MTGADAIGSGPAESREIANHGGVRLVRDTMRLPMAAIGEPNPLPPLAGLLAAPFDLTAADDVPEEIRRGIAYGYPDNLLPYLHQDDYDRKRRPGGLDVVVLENEILRARIAPGLGGRVWSLEHKPSGRDLVYRNRVLQPANFGLRNAWFSGGVEWNIGTRGHTVTSCAPVHAAVVERPDGAPMVRLWQWERLREVSFQVDLWLDGDVLLAYVRIRNPNAHPTPMYWWSNIAVPETPGTRVLAPARSAYHTGYGGLLSRVPIPTVDGVDTTYPRNTSAAADYFYSLDSDAQPWIAALDAEGRGLVHASTTRLRGRKFFVWGQSAGSRHWQEWLSGGGDPYLEIQAGLTTTQYEHVPMPARAEWSWVEAYGLAETDPAVVHGPDWDSAVDAVAAQAWRLASAERLAAELETATALADRAPGESLSRADGWGALERRRRAATGEPAPDSAGTPYDDTTLTDEQQPFVALLETGDLPELDPAAPPPGYVVGADWRKRLARSAPNWASLLYRGVACHAAGEADAAREAYQRSLRLTRTPWARRNLALLDGDADGLVEAHRMRPQLWQLAAEAGHALLAAGRPDEALNLVDAAPKRVRAHGRIRLLTAKAALAGSDVDRAGALLDEGIEVPDLREGEVALHDLWRDVEACRLAAVRGVPVDDSIRDEVRRLPVPRRYDFRMFGD